jgi:propanol-preferring alcohol dehydrogenase
MKAMILDKPGQKLRLVEIPAPKPSANQLLIKVRTCGVCRTDLHVLDGDLKEPNLPIIPGHQIVGLVEAVGSEVTEYRPGDRVGVPWLGGSCGQCSYCLNGRENLCGDARYTGYQINGGFAEKCVADRRFCSRSRATIPTFKPPLSSAPV